MKPIRFLPSEHAPVALGIDQPWTEAARWWSEAELTASGRHALGLILHDLELTPSDEVLVTTSTGLGNVSACVTSTIFNHAKPARVWTPATRAVLVIHEFGIPHPQLPKLATECHSRGIALIEDCAHTLASVGAMGQVGMAGDYALASLPKVCGLPGGGLVRGLRRTRVTDSASRSQNMAITQLRAQLRSHLATLGANAERRRMLAREVTDLLGSTGARAVHNVEPGVVPWFLPVHVADPEAVTARARRDFACECGLWHGSDVVVLPLHERLQPEDVHRYVDLLQEP